MVKSSPVKNRKRKKGEEMVALAVAYAEQTYGCYSECVEAFFNERIVLHYEGRWKIMKTGEFVAAFLDEFDTLVANWQKRKKGFNHHDGKRLVRDAMVNVFVRSAAPRREEEHDEAVGADS